MTDQTMIERMARAIHPAAWQPATIYDPRYAELRDLSEVCARAVLAAMREPTEAMLAAGMTCEGVDLVSEWRAMIDAALAEAGKG